MSVNSELGQFQRLSAEIFTWRRRAWCEGFLVGTCAGIGLALVWGWVI